MKATRRQLWYLHKLTGDDTRKWDLSKDAASELIAKHRGESIPKESKQVDPEYQAYKFIGQTMISTDYCPILARELMESGNAIQARYAPITRKTITNKYPDWTVSELELYHKTVTLAYSNLCDLAPSEVCEIETAFDAGPMPVSKKEMTKA